eukprot:6394086-Karenia_brevis.AAC.1
MIRMFRMSLLITLIVKSSPFLIAVLSSVSKIKTSWMYAVTADLKWLTHAPEFSACVSWSMEDWVHMIASQPQQFKKSMTKYCKSAFANICTQWADSK